MKPERSDADILKNIPQFTENGGIFFYFKKSNKKIVVMVFVF